MDGWMDRLKGNRIFWADNIFCMISGMDYWHQGTRLLGSAAVGWCRNQQRGGVFHSRRSGRRGWLSCGRSSVRPVQPIPGAVCVYAAVRSNVRTDSSLQGVLADGVYVSPP